MKKHLVVGLLLSASVVAQAQDDPIAAKYQISCAACHASGAAGAPKTGVPAAWAERLEKGMDVLVQSVEKGLNAMPPKGMCFDCTSDQYKALIEYMIVER